MFWEMPPETAAKSSRQEAEPEGSEQPSRESSPIKGSVAQWRETPGKNTKTLNHKDDNYIKKSGGHMLFDVFGGPLIMLKDFVLKSQYSLSS